MALDPELISQFAKLVNKDNKTKVESTVYGTIVEDGAGNKYVKLDGSDQLTPLTNDERPNLESTLVDANVGERVSVLIKDHTATVTGNVSSPAARTADVADVKQAQIVLAQQVQADYAYVKRLLADEATLGKLEAATASITDLIASTADIEQLLADKITVTDLIASKIDASVVQATYATILQLNATDAKIGILSADYASFKGVSTEKFTAYDANIQSLQTNSLTAEKADIAYAKIDFSNMVGVTIDEAAIEHLFASSGMVKDITINNGVITGELIGVTLNADMVNTGTLKADRLVVKGENGIYYKLNIEGGAVASAEVTEEELQNGLSGSVIIAKSITAEKVSVSDLVAFGATIGGFQITNNSIHSVTKQTVDATTRGFYVDNDGQLNVGDETNFIKFFRDTDGTYKLRISADSIVLGSSKKNVEDAIEEVADIEIGGTNLLPNSSFEKDLDKWYQGYPTNDNSILNIRKIVSGTDIITVDEVSPEQNSSTIILDYVDAGTETSNLLSRPYYYSAQTLNGITYTINKDGTITANGTASSTSFFILKNDDLVLPSGTYCISDSANLGDSAYVRISGQPGMVHNGRFTTDGTPLGVEIRIESGTKLDNTVFKPMINKGPMPYPYVPYWEELWDEVWETGYINASGNDSDGYSDRIRSVNYIPCLGDTAYYVLGGTAFLMNYYDEDKTFISQAWWSSGNSFITPSNCRYLRFATNAAYGGIYKNDIRIVRFITRGAAVDVCGRNLLSPFVKDIHINSSTGAEQPYNGAASTDYIRVDLMADAYYISGMPNNLYHFIAAYDANKNYLGRTGAGAVSTTHSINDRLANDAAVNETTYYIRITVYENSTVDGVISDLDNCTPFIVKGSEDISYEQYVGATYFADENGRVTITNPASPKMNVMSKTVGVNMNLSYKLISGFVTKAGKPCLNIKHLAFGETKTVYLSLLGKIDRDSKYIFSGWFLTENIVKGSTNPFIAVYGDGWYVDDTGVSNWYHIGEKNIPTDFPGEWCYMTYAFEGSRIPETATSGNLIIYTRDMTGDLYFCDLKLEKGNKATDWSPAPEDVELEISRLESSLSTTAEGIVAKVSASYVSKNEFGTYKDTANTKLEQTANGLKLSVEEVRDIVDEGEFSKVKVVGKNYVMNSDGFTIGSNDENNAFTTTITETGMKVKNNGNEALVADKDGVKAKDLHAVSYLIIGGNSRFEDYNGNRTACFWIGS